MKTKTQILSGSLVITLILSSCSIKKRVHMSGYYFEWKHSKSKPCPNETLKLQPNELVYKAEEKNPEEVIISSSPEQIHNDNMIIVPVVNNLFESPPANNSAITLNTSGPENDISPDPVMQVTKADKKDTKRMMGGGGKLLLSVIIGLLLFLLIFVLIAMLL
jgi:hypothetical protein